MNRKMGKERNEKSSQRATQMHIPASDTHYRVMSDEKEIFIVNNNSDSVISQ